MSTDFRGCHQEDTELVGDVADSVAAVVRRCQEKLGADVGRADHFLLYSDAPRLDEGQRSNESLKAIQAQHIATTQTALIAAEDTGAPEGFVVYPSARILRPLVSEPVELDGELDLCEFLKQSRVDLGREALELAAGQP